MKHEPTTLHRPVWMGVQRFVRHGWWFRLTYDNTDIWDACFWRGEARGHFPTIEHHGTGATPDEAIKDAASKLLAQHRTERPS